jgi:hypothetical protein
VGDFFRLCSSCWKAKKKKKKREGGRGKGEGAAPICGIDVFRMASADKFADLYDANSEAELNGSSSQL